MAIFDPGSATYPAGPNGIALANIRRLPRWLAAVMTFSSIAYTIYSLHMPVALRADFGIDDDLFVQHGVSLIAGHWLGHYNNLTLAKGPGFPFFLALNAFLGLPITFSLALVYSGACALVALTLFRIKGAPWLSLLCFLLMQWHPAMVPIRIIRDDISAPQVLLILACVCHFVFLPSRLRTRILWGVASRVLLAWFWMTREDGIWILPGLAVIIALQILRLLPCRREVLRLAGPVLAAGAAMLGTLAAVAAINLSVYGTFVIVDFKSNDFVRALDVLQSVRVGAAQAYVPVPAKVRAQLDIVSPAFASLETYFHENERGWEGSSCSIYPSTCGDIAGGWFMWALRDAVASEGDYSSAKAANAFYRRLWSQVHEACRSGRLECQKNLLPFMPPVLPEQWRQLPSTLTHLYNLATWQHGEGSWIFNEHLDMRSSGTGVEIKTMERLLGSPRRSPTADEVSAVTLSGWFHPQKKTLWLQAGCNAAFGNVVIPIIREPSPDLVSGFHDAGADMQRFTVQVPSRQDCWLEPEDANDSSTRPYFAKNTTNSSSFAGGLLSIDSITAMDPGQPNKAVVKIFSYISAFYALFIPTFGALSIVIYIGYLVRALLKDRRQRFDSTLIIVTGIGIMLIARATILVLVDISSFPAINELYWSAEFPLLLLAIILALSKRFENNISPDFPDDRAASRKRTENLI